MYIIIGVDCVGQQFQTTKDDAMQTQLYATLEDAKEACKCYKATYPWCDYYPKFIF